MIIKQPLLLAISGLAMLMAVALFLWRADFYLHSVQVDAQVVDVTASNGRCGGKHKHNCTRFSAVLAYSAEGKTLRTTTSAGSVRGYDQPTARADLRRGEHHEVRYDSRKHDVACVNTFYGVWGAPMFAMFVQIITLVGSFFEGRNRSI